MEHIYSTFSMATVRVSQREASQQEQKKFNFWSNLIAIFNGAMANK